MRRLAKPRRGERFLKGPVPLAWLEAAARLPGKSLHAGIALWYAAGLARSSAIPLSNIAGGAFGLDRNAKYRALAWLEEAGLVKVERNLGRAPIVTILELARPARRDNV
ncbi:MAG: hypothetical protein AB7L90_07255 [Hyphomicrobiaceae bacterium]|uniref:hypothetical protein n=1 Tax=Pseudorhodoplanes sp. TaxID=1934341 RepID=UPI003D0F3B87